MMEQKFSKKYISLVRAIIDESGFIDPDIVESVKIMENPFSDQLDVVIKFDLNADIGRSYVDDLVDNIWEIIYNTLNFAVAIRTNWEEYIARNKKNVVRENFDLWVKRREELFDGIFKEVFKKFSSKRDIKTYINRVNLSEFIDIIMNEVLEKIYSITTAQESNISYKALMEYLNSKYSDVLKKIWVQNRNKDDIY